MKSKRDSKKGNSKSFRREVYRLALQIPAGRVSTYGAIASALRREGASRAVGMALHMNPNSPHVPCHRVVYRDGQIGGYARGTELKIRLLKEEGVSVKDDRIQDFEEKLFPNFV